MVARSECLVAISRIVWVSTDISTPHDFFGGPYTACETIVYPIARLWLKSAGIILRYVLSDCFPGSCVCTDGSMRASGGSSSEVYCSSILLIVWSVSGELLDRPGRGDSRIKCSVWRNGTSLRYDPLRWADGLVVTRLWSEFCRWVF